MSDLQTVVAAVIAALATVAFFMIKSWARNWETRLSAHDDRLGEHDVHLATITANMEHIRVGVDETRDDVKELLRNSNNGSRNGSRSPNG